MALLRYSQCSELAAKPYHHSYGGTKGTRPPCLLSRIEPVLDDFDTECEPVYRRFIVRRYRRPKEFPRWNRNPPQAAGNCSLIFDAIDTKPACKGWVAGFEFIDDTDPSLNTGGIVYDETLPPDEIDNLRSEFGPGMAVMSRGEFVLTELLAKAYRQRATIISSPFALSRLAIEHSRARRTKRVLATANRSNLPL
jgi:hypothetical protein